MNSMSIVQSPTIMPHEERYKVIGYADDVKPWRSSWWWTDIRKITSSAKLWMYADMLLKPEEKIMHRPVTTGGLGVHHVRSKGLAGLIRTFLETACNPKLLHSLIHEVLFRYHVLQDMTS